MIYAAILAGGVGKRIERSEIPKQFLPVAGRPILMITLGTFLRNECFEKIYVAIHPEWKEYCEKLLAGLFSSADRERIIVIEGGKERINSFENVMNAILETRGEREEDILICHDAVRPFVTQQMINQCIIATQEDNVALTVVPTTDTIHVAQDSAYIVSTLDRNGLYNGQNPSGFRISVLKKALDSFTEKERAKVTGTTQLLLKLGYKIRMVQGHTSNFKITTDNDLDVADRFLRAGSKSGKVSLLDCTLRDGGIVIDFNFGRNKIEQIKETLEKSRVEMIECGYIDQDADSSEGRTQFPDERAIERTVLSTGKKDGCKYVAMIDYGRFDVRKLHERSENGIDGIRLAFHKEDWREAVSYGQIILSKGYELYIQPMVAMRYSDDEFRELIAACNQELKGASGFYIVDSFGQMDSVSLIHYLEIADECADAGMVIGFHAHNNRQMAYANALTFLEYNLKHDGMLDASIMGMGKGAGNLCTELIEEALNIRGKNYNATVLYDSISGYFAEQLTQTPWGYSLDYYLSSLYSCTPSYVKIFTSDHRVTTDMLIDLLKNIPENKRAACDKTFAKEYLQNYLDRMG